MQGNLVSSSGTAYSSNEIWPESPGITGNVIPVRKNPDGSFVPAWPGLIHGIVNSAYNALVSPGEILTGRDPLGRPANPNPLLAAQDTVGLLLGGGLAGAEENALGIFGGKLAKTADLKALTKAQKLEAEGGEKKAILDSTGWFRGVDGKWKFEIPDSKAQLGELPSSVAGSSVDLNKALLHPELYKAYPQMREIGLTNDAEGFGGSYQPGALGTAGTMTIGPDKTGTDALSILLHESQHGIQGIENFAAGGTPQQFLPGNWETLQAKHAAAQNMLDEQVIAAGKRPWEANWAVGKQLRNQPLSKEDQQIISALESHNSELVPALATHISNQGAMMGAESRALESYRTLAGEVEARNVEERFAQGDYGVAPWATEGYPAGKQIVQFDTPEMEKLSLEPVSHDPFSQYLLPVQHDPFEEKK